jgi:hypothetical protein
MTLLLMAMQYPLELRVQRNAANVLHVGGGQHMQDLAEDH